MRLIDADALIWRLEAKSPDPEGVGEWIEIIQGQPSVNLQEPCEDAISRDAVQDYIAKYLSQYLYDDVREAVEVIDEYIGELPSVTQKSETVTEFADRCRECGAKYGKLLKQGPKMGHWIRQDNTKESLYGWYFCSECNSVIGDKTKFCSNCGARMESEGGEK